jgi:uncharacterized protein
MSESQQTVPKGEARDAVEFRGHPMMRSSHPTTIELTTDEYLTEEGDCIIGVGAAKGCEGLRTEVKEAIRNPESRVTLRIVVEAYSFTVKAYGDPRLTLSDPHDMVIRKSDFASPRTLAIRADGASRDIPRDMVRLLKNPATKGRLEIEVD